MANIIPVKLKVDGATKKVHEMETGDTISADLVIDGSTNHVFTATDDTKLAGIEAAADVTDATNVAAAGAVMEGDTTTAAMSFVIDEDNMASNLATKVPTQQSVKAYADTKLILDGNGNIPGMKHHLIATIIDPLAVQTEDNEICLWEKVPANLTITSIEVTLDATTNQVAGDVKQATDFISLGTAAVINDFDTTSGVRSDTSITAGTVAAGQCIYLSFDSAPDTAIKQMNIDLVYDYD